MSNVHLLRVVSSDDTIIIIVNVYVYLADILEVT